MNKQTFEVVGLHYNLDMTGQERVLVSSFIVHTFSSEHDAKAVAHTLNQNAATTRQEGALEYVVNRLEKSNLSANF